MRWRIIAVGKPRLAYARDGITEYLTRIKCFATVEEIIIKASNPAKEGAQLLSHSSDCFRLVLDERGKELTSRDFAARVREIEIHAHKPCAVIVGGADGHTSEVREKADFLWGLSKMTLQHELALLFALEQIYRAHTILAGLPYHRD